MSPVTGLVFLASYLVGAIPFGYLVGRWRGVDLFQQGSGNIGATNVGRLLGRRFGILVFLLDFAKGALPVMAATLVTPDESLPADTLRVGTGLAAFLGHLFPVYLRFRGGKGVATGAGVVVVLLPGPALGALLTWAAVVCASRYVSLASLSAAAVLCLLRLCLTAEPFAPENQLVTLFCFLATGLVFARHHANIRRLLHGSENRLRETPAMLLLTKTVHVLALGLWFGMSIFFTFVVGLSLFGNFQTLAQQDERPLWFARPTAFDRDPETWPDRSVAGQTPLFQDKRAVHKEQGTRIAGTAISPLFDWFFLIQGVCGLLTVLTALSWSGSEPSGRVNRIRSWVLLLALVTVVVGWPMERKVSELRVIRNERVDTVLRSEQPDPKDLSAAQIYAAEFVRWHLYSLFLNFGTVALVTLAMALAARLPSESRDQKPSSRSQAAEAGIQGAPVGIVS